MSFSPENLRSTSKANLKYHRDWQIDNKFYAMLERIANDERFISLHPACLVDSNMARFGLQSSPEQRNEISTTSLHKSMVRANLEQPLPMSPINAACHEPNDTFQKELEIKECENQQLSKIQENINCKREYYERSLAALYEKSLLELRMLRERRLFLDRMRRQELEAATEAGDDEVNRRHQKLRNDHESYAKMADERLKEASLRDKQEEEEALRRVELRQKIEALAKCKQNVSATYQEIVAVVRSCPNLHLVPEDLRATVQSMNEVVADVQKILDRVRTGKVCDADLDLMRLLEAKTNACLEIITHGVELANKAALAEKSSPEHSADVKSPSTGTIEKYMGAMATLNDAMDSYKDLSSDTNLKAYRATFKMAINAPVNAISAQSVSQVHDKLMKLCAILAGRQVDLTTGRRFCVDEHPQGRLFCMDLLAKKFINQGEKQVSSSHVAAFPIAFVIIGLWKAFPAFGELLLSHFYVKCPYLVPYHLPRSDGQSDVDYQSELGYEVIDGVLEHQDKFLERISGIVRLYAAVVQSPVSRGSDRPHPHGVEHAWRWLACTLSIDPLPDISATVVYNVLDVCGHALQKTYGRQFHKLILFLRRCYVPKIKSVTAKEGSGGPTTRLETLLQEYISRGKMIEPEGILPSNFWLT